MSKQTIRVVYPLHSTAQVQLVLRTSLDDWREDIHPILHTQDNFIFELETTEPYFHFKPCLIENGDLRWSVGSNYLCPFPQDRTLYPFFDSDPEGSITELETLCSDKEALYRYRVYLPAGYDENSLRHYPVCYMHDGHNLFFPHEAFAGHTWRVRETVELLDRMNSIEACIVVAIYPNERIYDYTEPGCEDYAVFLRRQLVPHIEKQYRTLLGPEHRVVMGSSLGGLVSFYLAWHHDDVFGRAACLSSTFGYDNALFESVKRSRRKRNTKLYLDSGWPGDNFEVTQAMAHLLVSKGYAQGDDLHYVAVPQATHDEFAWGNRLHLPFQFLLGLSYGLDNTIDNSGSPFAA